MLDIGPLAHLSHGSGLLRGQEMLDEENLITDSGKGILIENGQISAIEDSDELREEYLGGQKGRNLSSQEFDGIELLEVGGRAVIPGLVDAHTHLMWGGDRSREARWRQQGLSYHEIAQKGGGIAHTVNETRGLPLDNLVKIGLDRIHTALLNGTTAMEVKSGYGLDTECELRLLQAAEELRGVSIDSTWLGAHAAPPGMKREDYVEQILSEQLPEVLDSGLARSADVFCEPGWFTLEETEEICKAAMAGGMDIRLHVDEFADAGGLSLAAEINSLSGDHAHWSSDDARSKADAANTLQCFLPGTPYSMGETHFPPASECIENGYAWAAATDFNPNCRILSLPFVGSLLTQRMGVDPLASLVAVSRNPAQVTMHEEGLDHGMIKVGGAADINILASPFRESWCQQPSNSPFAVTLRSGVATYY